MDLVDQHRQRTEARRDGGDVTPEPIGPTLSFLASQRTFVIRLAFVSPPAPPRRSLETVGADGHLGPRRASVRAVHADTRLHHDGRDARGDLIPAFAFSLADLRHRVDRCETQHPGADLGHHAADGAGFGQGVGPLAVGRLNNALKKRLGARAVRYSLLSAAVTSKAAALPASRANSSPSDLSLVFITVFDPPAFSGPRPCRLLDPYVI
jgi:hypothetical protein